MSEYSDQNSTPTEPPAQPTEAQQEQAEQSGQESVPANDKPSQASLDQARADAEYRAENPNEPIARDANPEVAGESFAYLDNVGKA